MVTLKRITALLIGLLVITPLAQASEPSRFLCSLNAGIKQISTEPGKNSAMDGNLLYQLNSGDGYIELFVRDAATLKLLALTSVREGSPSLSLVMPQIGADVSCQNLF